MKAVAFDTFGGPEVLEIIETDLPEPRAGELRIRVAAAPLQPADVSVRKGLFGPMVPAGPSYVLGWDVAGVVDAIGPDVSAYGVGDDVVGMSHWLMTKVGTHAEYVVLPAADLAPAPAGIAPALASTLPVNALTAAQALDAMALTAGQTLVITGAGGAVGGYAVELARLRGIEVIGIASAQDESFLRERGAGFVGRGGDPVAAVRAAQPAGVDGLLDAASLGQSVIGAVRDGGTFAGLIPPAAPQPERGINLVRPMVHTDGKALRELVGLAENGDLTPRVAQTFSFDEATEAHALFEKGGLRGRAVLIP